VIFSLLHHDFRTALIINKYYGTNNLAQNDWQPYQTDRQMTNDTLVAFVTPADARNKPT